MAKEMWLYNGQVIPAEECRARLSVDWLRHAPGFFDSLRVFEHELFHWEWHYLRMQRAAQWWQRDLPSSKTLLEAVRAYLSETGGNGKLRIQWAPNGMGWDYAAVLEPRDTAFRWDERGLRIGVYKTHFKWATDTANLKVNQRDIYIQARDWANASGLDDALIINGQGQVVDSTVCNVFWIEGDTLFTPTLHAGPVRGVTRDRMLDLLPKEGWDIREKDAFPAVLERAEEVFLTNALKGIIPVSSFSGTVKPTARTRRLFDWMVNGAKPY